MTRPIPGSPEEDVQEPRGIDARRAVEFHLSSNLFARAIAGDLLLLLVAEPRERL
jgi:hypothetical protein